jgi:hypothetical protein
MVVQVTKNFPTLSEIQNSVHTSHYVSLRSILVLSKIQVLYFPWVSKPNFKNGLHTFSVSFCRSGGLMSLLPFPFNSMQKRVLILCLHVLPASVCSLQETCTNPIILLRSIKRSTPFDTFYNILLRPVESCFRLSLFDLRTLWIPFVTIQTTLFHSSVICQTTGPQPLPKRFLHLMQSRASSFKWHLV